MRELAELDRRQSLELLERGRVGRVALCTPMGPRVVPVNYVVREECVLFRTTPYSEVGTYGRDNEIAFEVDEIDEERRTGQSAVAFGRAEAVDDHEELRRLRAELEPTPWAGGPRYLIMRLQIRDLTGRRVGG